MLERIKTALRISHSLLDDEIKSTIEVARAEMIRSGISKAKANSENDELINNAIITYCKFSFSSDSKASDGFFQSWLYQLDNLRKSAPYKDGDSDERDN